MSMIGNHSTVPLDVPTSKFDVDIVAQSGIHLTLFDRDSSVDKKTGEIILASTSIQIQAENTLPNGQKRIELQTLKVDNPAPYRKLLNQSVHVPVGVFASGNGVQFYALKGQGIQG